MFSDPDLRGRTVFGFDSSNATGRLANSATGGLSASTLRNTGGEQSPTLVVGEIPVHNHSVNDPTNFHFMGNSTPAPAKVIAAISVDL
jgi:microcystin-dependent protein